jgi:hypothetical protein
MAAKRNGRTTKRTPRKTSSPKGTVVIVSGVRMVIKEDCRELVPDRVRGGVRNGGFATMVREDGKPLWK